MPPIRYAVHASVHFDTTVSLVLVVPQTLFAGPVRRAYAAYRGLRCYDPLLLRVRYGADGTVGWLVGITGALGCGEECYCVSNVRGLYV